MSQTTLVVGIDGSKSGEKALEFAKNRAKLSKNSKILVCYVIEWSPFTFQTAEENEQRHKRREEETALAKERILDPALSAASDTAYTVEGVVKHGDAAEILDRLAKENSAEQIIVGRVGAKGLKERLFGGVSGRLIATSSVPVTIIP
jgi:nucleotide-binding universal stress UspA family protein